MFQYLHIKFSQIRHSSLYDIFQKETFYHLLLIRPICLWRQNFFWNSIAIRNLYYLNRLCLLILLYNFCPSFQSCLLTDNYFWAHFFNLYQTFNQMIMFKFILTISLNIQFTTSTFPFLIHIISFLMLFL